MEWRDTGIVVGLRRHGERGKLLSVLTRDHGRHAGLIRSVPAGLTQGIGVAVHWRARLEDHLGHFDAEITDARAAVLLADAPRLRALAAACAMVKATLPERAPMPDVFNGLAAVMTDLCDGHPTWPARYCLWELDLLADLGHGVDVSTCAVTGETDDIAYVSPRTGHGVSRRGAGNWVDRLLPLPPFLRDRVLEPVPGRGEVQRALALTGRLFGRMVFDGKPPPSARTRFVGDYA